MQIQIDEDELIAEGFIKLKQGILSQDWQMVLEVYNSISGETLKLPEQKKSRLEKIREKMQSSPPVSIEEKKDSQEPIKKDVVIDGSEEINLTTKKEKGGKIFSKEGFEVVSAIPDEEERRKNQELARKKVKVPRPRHDKNLEKVYNSNKNSEGIGYSDQPKQPPPWA